MSDIQEKQALIERLARFVVPGDYGMRERVASAIGEMDDNYDPEGSYDEAVIAAADDEFLCSETQALWDMVRQARELLK